MSKNKTQTNNPSNTNKNPSNTTNTHQEPEMKNEPVPAPEAEAATSETGVIVASTSLAVVAESLPADAPGRKFLTVLPTQYHEALVELVEPTNADLRVASETLDERSRQGFNSWLKKTDTKKVGFHVAQTDFRLPDLRIDQGSGNDMSKPGNSMKGCTYDSDGNLVTAFGQASQMLSVPERFVGAVVAVHGTRQMWPPKDDAGNVIPLPGLNGDFNKNQPLCGSMDRQVGSRWGDCSKCNYRPFATGQPRKNECKDEFHFYVVRMDPNGEFLPFSAVYRIVMTSTSVLTGAKPINQRIKGWPQIWDRLFSFETVQQSRGNMSWFQWKTNLAIGPGQPAGIATSAEQRKLLEQIARKIDAAIFYPALAGVYGRSAGGNALPAGPENVADMNALGAAIDGTAGAAMDPAANL